MQIFLLKPIDPKNHHWGASIYCELLTIRAENEERAREIAGDALWEIPQLDPGMPTPLNPWDVSTGTASCEVLEDANDDPNGEEAILAPAEYDSNWRR